MKGWISLHRRIRDHWIWQEKPFDKRSAWIDLLMMANHQENKILIGTNLVDVARGSFITSEVKLSERWGWSRKKVRMFLEVLEKDKMLVKKSTTKYTSVTIENYEEYQNQGTTKEQEKNSTGTSKEHQKNTNNNDNNENNDNNISSCEDEGELKFQFESIEYRLADYLRKHILKNNPTAKVPSDKEMDKWSQHIDYMIRLDKRSADDIKAVIEFSQKDDFWMTNILSTAKLRKQFDQLHIKSQQKSKQTQLVNQQSKIKTKFHLAKSRGDKYSADELEQLILGNQKNRRVGNAGGTDNIRQTGEDEL